MLFLVKAIQLVFSIGCGFVHSICYNRFPWHGLKLAEFNVVFFILLKNLGGFKRNFKPAFRTDYKLLVAS